jgi:hypothetical protein
MLTSERAFSRKSAITHKQDNQKQLAVLFVGGFVLLALATIIDQTQNTKGTTK